MKYQFRLFLTAVMFYTRIPVPTGIGHSPELLNRATRYLPLIGWLVGGIVALVYYGSEWLWSPAIAGLLALAAGIWLTGAFHEDGFADVCDGFGGGWTAEQVLTIMKDSRVGAYAAIGLVLLLGLKLAALVALPVAGGLTALLIAHSLSRLLPVLLIAGLPYARADASSKVRPVAQGIGGKELIPAIAFGMLPLLGAAWYWQAPLLLLVPLALVPVGFYLARMYERRIGGYTGDCLGAAQQVAELTVYLFFAAAWKYI